MEIQCALLLESLHGWFLDESNERIFMSCSMGNPCLAWEWAAWLKLEASTAKEWAIAAQEWASMVPAVPCQGLWVRSNGWWMSFHALEWASTAFTVGQLQFKSSGSRFNLHDGSRVGPQNSCVSFHGFRVSLSGSRVSLCVSRVSLHDCRMNLHGIL